MNVFFGSLGAGETCRRGSECAPGSMCLPVGDGTTLQCFDPKERRGKLGESCGETCTDFGDVASCGGAGAGGDAGFTGMRCYTNDRLYCGKENTCVALSMIGQACISTYYCAEAAFCENGICAAKRTSGSCAQSNDACASSSYCDSNRECQPRKPTGAACSNYSECQPTDQCRDGICRAYTVAGKDVCQGGLG